MAVQKVTITKRYYRAMTISIDIPDNVENKEDYIIENPDAWRDIDNQTLYEEDKEVYFLEQ